MQQSQSIKNLSKALAQFRVDVGKIGKDAKNPFFKSKYATLSHVLTKIEAPMAKNGLTYIQMPDGDDCMTTRIIHIDSGEYIQSTHNMKPENNKPQAIGSAITYARRYGLVCALGLDVDGDDDGNAASGNIDPTNIPSKSEKDELTHLLYETNLTDDEKEAAKEMISQCDTYQQYQKIKYRLEDRKLSIDEIPNPSQKDIADHVKKVAK